MATPDALNSTTRTLPPAKSSRRPRWLRVLARVALFLIVLIALAVTAGLAWLRSMTRAALPVLDGDVHISGLSAPVTVRRDTHGVPHIEAATQDDMFLAQGYVTAQDRLWQMDLYRRNANGELAEILGTALVRHDRAQRVFGFSRLARQIYARLAPDERRRMDDYARGVNLFIAQHPDSLPPEFRLLMYRPQPWTGADCVSIGMMMVDMLDTHWDVKLARERIAAKLNDPKLESDLYPVGSWRDRPPTGEVIDLTQPRPAPPPSNDDEDEDRTQTELGPGVTDSRARFRNLDSSSRNHSVILSEEDRATARSSQSKDLRFALPDSSNDLVDLQHLRAVLGRPDCDGCAPGSNNWVISGKHTASGKPLLSNDMHLQLTEPNIWYMADLRAPGFHAAGVTLPGLPFVIAGHNEHVAWGFTALYADVQDLYVERLDGKGNYQANDATWKPLAIDREIIHVRGKKDVTVDVESTDHGPLLNPILPSEQRPVALKWTLYDTAGIALPALRNEHGIELGRLLRRSAHMELAHAKCRLLR